MAEALSGASRAAIQRNLGWLEERGIIREITGQDRYRMWRAMNCRALKAVSTTRMCPWSLLPAARWADILYAMKRGHMWSSAPYKAQSPVNLGNGQRSKHRAASRSRKRRAKENFARRCACAYS